MNEPLQDFDEYRKAVKADAQEAMRDKHLIEGLKEDPGWLRLVEMLEKNLKCKEVQLIYGEVQDQREDDIDRGYCQAVKLVLQMPELVIQTSDDAIKLAEELDDGSSDTE